ncbi:MAG TPA: limonene-1,2-epoxide hydrolase family protein [Acidimicrobiia bacterium]
MTNARTPTDTVRDFCAAWTRLDIDELLGYFTPDAVYHNIPVDPVVGVDAIRAMMAMFTTGVERIEFRVKNLATTGNVVMTERVDVFVQPERTIELPVMGTFEVVDGKIAAWRDYFDLNQYMTQAGMA